MAEAGTMPKFPIIVRGKSVQTYPDLLTAGQHYIKQYFTDWLNRRQCSIVPPIPWVAYNRALGPPLQETRAARIPKERGDNAELIVYKNVYTCGEKFDEPMFLIAQMDFDPDNKSKHTSAVLKSFLPEAKQKQVDLASKKLDIDLLIIHVDIGVVIVEIKAAKNPLVEIGSAIASLCKAENFLRLFCDEAFPIYKIAVFVNCESLNEDQKTEISRLEVKDGFMLCDKDFAAYPEEVERILASLKTKTREKYYPNIIDQTDNLLYWIISLKCLISSTVHDKMVAKVILMDEAINVVKQVKYTDAKLVQHDVYSKAEQKSVSVRKLKIAKEVLYLNPEQIAIWDGPKWQILSGVAGTGKTILIQHKILELDRSLPLDEKIVVVATDAVSRVYEDFFKLNMVTQRVEVHNKANLSLGYNLQEKMSQLCEHNLFIDEAQSIFNTEPELWTAVSRNKKASKYLWIALDPIQALEKLTDSLEEVEARLEISRLPPLCHVMRCTPEVTSYWSKHIPNHCTVLYNQGNRLFVQDVPVYYALDNGQVVDIVFNLLEKFVDGENIHYKDCAVLIHSPILSIIPIRKGLLKKLGWSDEMSYLCSMDKENIIIKDMPNDIWSLEWSYVFLVAEDAVLFPTEKVLDARLNKEGYWDSGIYLASSRCKVQLFLISLEKGKQLNVDKAAIKVKPDRVKVSFTLNF